MNSNFTPLTVVVARGASEGELVGAVVGESVTLTVGIMDGDALGASVDSEGLILGESENKIKQSKRKIYLHQNRALFEDTTIRATPAARILLLCRTVCE